jgi:hypothetical protein
VGGYEQKDASGNNKQPPKVTGTCFCDHVSMSVSSGVMATLTQNIARQHGLTGVYIVNEWFTMLPSWRFALMRRRMSTVSNRSKP